MLDVFLVLIVLIIIICGCLTHRSTRSKLYNLSSIEAELVRRAAEHSIMASNTINPMIALVEATRAVEVIEVLHYRFGNKALSELVESNTAKMLDILVSQRNKILMDVLEQNPGYDQSHPLNEHARFISKNT
jgi:hypothetical protein